VKVPPSTEIAPASAPSTGDVTAVKGGIVALKGVVHDGEAVLECVPMHGLFAVVEVQRSAFDDHNDIATVLRHLDAVTVQTEVDRDIGRYPPRLVKLHVAEQIVVARRIRQLACRQPRSKGDAVVHLIGNAAVHFAAFQEYVKQIVVAHEIRGGIDAAHMGIPSARHGAGFYCQEDTEPGAIGQRTDKLHLIALFNKMKVVRRVP